jgi:type IV pilus biogenesis protein CpaD/CtpE
LKNVPIKALILIISILSLLAACASSDPELTVLVDTTKCPYLKYERDHAVCLERARCL